MNIKFLGLYGISFFFFLAFGLAGSIYYVATSKEDWLELALNCCNKYDNR